MIEKKSKIGTNSVRLFYHGEEEILFSDEASLFDVFGTGEYYLIIWLKGQRNSF